MEAIIFVGIQASGKTTFFQQRFFDTHVRINMDMLKTRYRERLLLQACLAGKQPFVVDNTNILAAEREVYISAAHAHNFRIIGYFFRTELRAALWRNGQRGGKQVIPVPGIIAKWKRLQPPVYDEGYDELFTVELTREWDFVVEPVVRYPE